MIRLTTPVIYNVPRLGSGTILNPGSVGLEWILENGTWNNQGIWTATGEWQTV